MIKTKNDEGILDESNYTRLAQRLANEHARTYYGITQSMDAEPEFARVEQRAVIRPHNDLNGLSEQEAENVTKDWIKSAQLQAERFAVSRNNKCQPKSYDISDPTQVKVRESTLDYISRKKKVGRWQKR